jgi:hypothetical protein
MWHNQFSSWNMVFDWIVRYYTLLIFLLSHTSSPFQLLLLDLQLLEC